MSRGWPGCVCGIRPEVGLQNAGLASGLALEMGKVATVGLAPALFGPWMNITGSLLASYWSKRQPPDEP